MLKITFQTNYPTKWGQQIIVSGNIPELGNGNPLKGIVLSYLVGDNWSKTIEITADSFEYQYFLVNDDFQILHKEMETPRVFSLPKEMAASAFILKDSWRNKKHPENALYNAAFLKVIFNPKTYKTPKLKAAKKALWLRFQIHAPRLTGNQQLCILGNIPALGSWGAGQPLLLGSEQYPLWTADVSCTAGVNVVYKYGIYDTAEKAIVFLENGSNRTLATQAVKGQSMTIVNDTHFKHPDGNWKGAGLAIPVFALRSAQGLGIGEFTDLKLLVDWAKKVGLKMVQILPINDTSATATWVDSYPYAAISVFALHPMYLNIEQLRGFDKIINKQVYSALQTELNALPTVDYEAVNSHKLAFARQIFNAEKSRFFKSKTFKTFFENNAHWLKPYAYFCTLRDKFGTTDFEQWGEDSLFSEERMKGATDEASPNFEEIAFHYYLQYQLDAQLQAMTAYARANQIVLKGDIPIGIYRYSVDAWTQPHLYHMDAQAGAPPDPFSDVGQNWGFPTYNWPVMAEDGYAWWQNRLKTLSKYFDAFRIDHILGFFRIWQVPYEHIEASLGYFYPALPVTYYELESRGIAFDYQRYCKPFITHDLVNDWFGEYADFVRYTFLEDGHDNRLAFKTAFDCQRKVAAFFKQEDHKHLEHLQKKLFDLHSNILFIEVPNSNGQAFHPRFDLYKTDSYQRLHEHLQDQIYGVYLDYFYNRQEAFWAESAMRKLPAIKSATDMLICGEDLGMIPNCVAPVMQDLDIFTLEIQRMSKNPDAEFLQTADTPYYSVVSPSTHDMSPLRLWWEESEKGYIQRFYNNEMNLNGLAPTTCTPALSEQIIEQHLQLPSMWAVFPIADLLGMSETLRHPNPLAERINEPSNPHHYWRYRLHIGMEELLAADAFNAELEELLNTTGRS